MRRRLRYFRLFILMTFVFAVVLVIYLSVKGRTKPPETEVVTEKPKVIVVAATDLMPRTLLTSELLEEREVSIVPEGVITSKEEAVNRLTKTIIRRGEPIFQQHLTPVLKELSAAYLIPPGQIGMALAISRPETVPPLKVGDYISIHAVFAGVKVKTIVPRSMVLAINNRVNEVSFAQEGQTQTATQQQTQTPSPEFKQLILLVALSPMEAKAVALAMDSNATLYYTLHPAPIPTISPLPDLGRDLTLQELTGFRPIIRETRPPSPAAPFTLEPFTLQLNRIEGSLRNLSQRVKSLEAQANLGFSRPARTNTVREHQIVGVIGDQKVVISTFKSEGGR